MSPQLAPIIAALGFLPPLASWSACLMTWLIALELLSRRKAVKANPRGAFLCAGSAAGIGVWAQPLLAAAWPAQLGLDPAITSIALVAVIGAAALAFSIDRAFTDGRGFIGGGAVLGAAIAFSHGAQMFALRGETEIDFTNVPIATATAIATPLAVAALMIRRRLPGVKGQIGAGLCLTSATVIAQVVGSSAILLQPDSVPDLTEILFPAASMAPTAGALLITVLFAIRIFAAPTAARCSTSAPA